MWKCQRTRLVSHTQAALAASCRCWSDSRRAGWPARFGILAPLPRWPHHVQWAQGLEAVEIALCNLPDDVVFVQSASWYPGRRSYAIPLLVHVDGLYQAELYVALVVLRARRTHCVVWGVWGTQWSLENSKGCIDAALVPPMSRILGSRRTSA